ncbi:MCM-domain-containing protein [Gonapodya prolifera JEL478]|uniref:DNA replication licensing factor MCM7 n=1 Tax=Gonapodya prolifera (strain JEL478) TaxID=1344416 RepID=A0A139AMF7_GONPJ|nr:MCM-domain-containing protein [Gonapodya prolifera JEL478]|eukprot:KXS17754.1 MCM-domain-containing protein [Gonapodya prolifera JEL478]
MAATSAANYNFNYANETDALANFLEKFEIREDENQMEVDTPRSSRRRPAVNVRRKYQDQLKAISDGESDTITVELDDLNNSDDIDESLIQHIQSNTKRYIDLFSRAIDRLLPENHGQITEESSPLEVIMYQRRRMQQAGQENQNPALPPNQPPQYPPALTRRFNVFIKPLSKDKALAVRDVHASRIGHLVTVRGIVTRVSNVKPLLKVAAYSCDKCGSEIFEEVTKQQYTPRSECPSQQCKQQGTRGVLYPQTRASKFETYQEVKLQEMTDQVPIGHIPRTMTVHLYGSLVRQVKPGDSVHIGGIWVPTPHVGYAARFAGLITDTFLEAMHVTQLKQQYSQMTISHDAQARIEQLADDPDTYELLSKSIAPEIYGHEDVKKALLLLLVGGVPKETGDSMKIRGELNVCLMGDPGMAKSQLLKYISKIAPRGVYTTGRGSSGVGLTAAVTKDPVTNEMVLEGGALVLADNGIACIDEFDKMDESDRTAIHEVMEQQTISIAKAGITTTLNARASILAAANPAFGRYNTKMRPTQNINLPAALLSRFDLLFLILDKADDDDDTRLAKHVTYVHQHLKQPPTPDSNRLVSIDLMKQYISRARQFRPRLSKQVADYVVNQYVKMRGDQTTRELQYTSARTLLSIIRMATAKARLRFSDEATEEDVREAVRLLDVSKSSLATALGAAEDTDPSDRIYSVLRERAQGADGAFRSVRIADLESACRAKGITQTQIDAFFDEYTAMGVIEKTGTTVRWIHTGADGDDVEEDY